MWTVVRPGDILYIGNTPVGVALSEVKMPEAPAKQLSAIAEEVTKGNLRLNGEALSVLDHMGFNVWKSDVQRRKFEIQRKYSTATNEDFLNKLSSIEEWCNEPEGSGRNPLSEW